MSSIKLSEDEIDDLIYFSRADEKNDLVKLLTSLAEREKVSPAEILIAAKDDGKSTCLHMATGNGHLGECNPDLSYTESPISNNGTRHCKAHIRAVRR